MELVRDYEKRRELQSLFKNALLSEGEFIQVVLFASEDPDDGVRGHRAEAIQSKEFAVWCCADGKTGGGRRTNRIENFVGGGQLTHGVVIPRQSWVEVNIDVEGGRGARGAFAVDRSRMYLVRSALQFKSLNLMKAKVAGIADLSIEGRPYVLVADLGLPVFPQLQRLLGCLDGRKQLNS